MAKCVRCGRPIPEGARLCARCSAAPGTPKPAPKQPRGMLAALIVLAVLTAAAFTLVIVQALGAHGQRVQLRVREEALDEREAEFAAVQETLDETKRSLSDAQGEIAAQDEQLEQLRTELSDAQHAANQSQYDMTAQKAELERLREENAALQDSVPDRRA